MLKKLLNLKKELESEEGLEIPAIISIKKEAGNLNIQIRVMIPLERGLKAKDQPEIIGGPWYNQEKAKGAEKGRLNLPKP